MKADLGKSFLGRRDKKFEAIKGPKKYQCGCNMVGEKTEVVDGSRSYKGLSA